MGHADDGGAGLVGHAGGDVGDDEELAAAGADYLDVGLELVQQFVIGRHHHQDFLVDQGQRAVLELVGDAGVSQGVC